MKIIRWREHAKMYAIDAGRLRFLLAGRLHALVDVALLAPQELDATMIETDGGQMFCRCEIHYIGLLADRPAG